MLRVCDCLKLKPFSFDKLNIQRYILDDIHDMRIIHDVWGHSKKLCWLLNLALYENKVLSEANLIANFNYL